MGHKINQLCHAIAQKWATCEIMVNGFNHKFNIWCGNALKWWCSRNRSQPTNEPNTKQSSRRSVARLEINLCHGKIPHNTAKRLCVVAVWADAVTCLSAFGRWTFQQYLSVPPCVRLSVRFHVPWKMCAKPHTACAKTKQKRTCRRCLESCTFALHMLTGRCIYKRAGDVWVRFCCINAAHLLADLYICRPCITIRMLEVVCDYFLSNQCSHVLCGRDPPAWLGRPPSHIRARSNLN